MARRVDLEVLEPLVDCRMVAHILLDLEMVQIFHYSVGYHKEAVDLVDC